MKDLAGTQRLFWEAIRHPTGVEDFVKAGGPERRSAFDEVFAQSNDFSRYARVQVYAEAYFYRLLDVLRETFPVVLSALGETQFHNLVTDYLLAHPSDNPNLHHLGAAFPDFIAHHDCSRARDYLPDFARVELALTRAIDAEDVDTLQTSTLVSFDADSWARLPLQLVPSASVVPTRYHMTEAHRAAKDGSTVDEPSRMAPNAATLVFRRDHKSFFRPLEPTEAMLLADARRGTTFHALCDVATSAGQTPEFVAHGLGRWVADGLFAAPGAQP